MAAAQYAYWNAIQVFNHRMLNELMANHPKKGDFLKWFPDWDQAMSELTHHFGKLVSALYHGDAHQLTEYSADMANIAMAIHRNFGLPDHELLHGKKAKVPRAPGRH